MPVLSRWGWMLDWVLDCSFVSELCVELAIGNLQGKLDQQLVQHNRCRMSALNLCCWPNKILKSSNKDTLGNCMLRSTQTSTQGSRKPARVCKDQVCSSTILSSRLLDPRQHVDSKSNHGKQVALNTSKYCSIEHLQQHDLEPWG